jgi:uncharacterized peroxidase-related enzyme
VELWACLALPRRLDALQLQPISASACCPEYVVLRGLANAGRMFCTLLSARSRYPLECSSQARLSSQSPLQHQQQMSFLEPLPTDAGLLQIFQAFPETAGPLLEYHEVLLRGESPFSTAERELIAAYVSGLNNCNYCRAVHSQTAVALGIDAHAMSKLITNPANNDANHRMRPVLQFVRKLTLSPGEITLADTDPIFAAGWDDRVLHNAVAICGLFNLMNRVINGLGIEAPEPYIKMAAQRLATGGYAQLLDLLPTSSK